MAIILLVEDDPEISGLLSLWIRDAGHELLLANNGKEALNVCKGNRVDLVITDLVMPVMEGTELIVQLRGIFPDVKVIAMSGGGAGAAGAYLRPSRHLGASGTLPKPFSRDELYYAVEEALKTSGSPRN